MNKSKVINKMAESKNNIGQTAELPDDILGKFRRIEGQAEKLFSELSLSVNTKLMKIDE